MRSFKPEMSHGANAGLPLAYNLIKPVKAQFPELGWADLIQVGGCLLAGVGGCGQVRAGAGGCWHMRVRCWVGVPPVVLGGKQ